MSKFHYKIEGTPNSPVIIFSNSLGSEMMMWDEVIPYLLPYFRVVRYDNLNRGILPQSLTIDDLGRDVLELADELAIDSFYFCGLSMGGLIGQWLGINASNRLKKLIISNTGAKIGNDERWNSRIETITSQGMGAIVEDTMLRWFTDEFRVTNPKRVDETKAMFLRSNIQAYANCCEAIRDADFRNSLHQVAVTTLVITGDEDPVTNVEQAEFLANNIPDASLKVLPARHLASTELPQEYAQVLIDFIVGSEVSERGMHVRRTVLGHEHVNRANAKKNEFNADFQDFITKYAWGDVWTRPGLSKHDKSLVTIAMLIALNRATELKMHIRAAFNNGVSKQELKEVFMQAALYCGLPAANDAFHHAEDVFKEIEQN